LKLKIADLTGKLADLKLTLIEAKEEVAERQAEIERLSGLLKHRSELIEAGGYKYDKTADGKPKGHAYVRCASRRELSFTWQHFWTNISSVRSVKLCIRQPSFAEQFRTFPQPTDS